MKPVTPLPELLSAMTTEVLLVKAFASEVHAVLKSRPTPTPDGTFTPDEVEDLGKALAKANELIAASAKAKREGPLRLTISTNSERVGSYFMKLAGTVKHDQFLAEMALSYLVSFLEAFMKDYALAILLSDHRMLVSKATVTYDELSKHRSLASVWRSAAEKEADTLGYGSIDDMATYFKKRVQSDLTSYQKWQVLREIVYRRNLVIHNRGKVNEIYRRKLNYKDKSQVLKTNPEYVSEAADTIVEFFKHVHTVVSGQRAK